MNFGIKDKVAVVTASSRGLGRAVASALAEEGAKLAICSRDGEKIAETGKFLEGETGVEVLAEACDVTSGEDIERFKEKVLDRFGTVHVLFTNAGGPAPGTVLDMDAEQYSAAVELNLLSAIRLVQAFLPRMQSQRWGRIIASTSITVKQPIPTLALSNVSRVGLAAYIKSLAREVGPYNITANTVAPGYILTERVTALLENRAEKEHITVEAASQDLVQEIPVGRIGRPEEFGALVAFLASQQAAYINGETVLIDGGFYKGLF